MDKETPYLDMLLKSIEEYEEKWGERPLTVSVCKKCRSEIRKDGFQFRIGKWKNMPEMVLGRPLVENKINGRELCLICEKMRRDEKSRKVK